MICLYLNALLSQEFDQREVHSKNYPQINSQGSVCAVSSSRVPVVQLIYGQGISQLSLAQTWPCGGQIKMTSLCFIPKRTFNRSEQRSYELNVLRIFRLALIISTLKFFSKAQSFKKFACNTRSLFLKKNQMPDMPK